ncbi:MAG: T9SS type A sorting domain-containing protein [Sphingobacteriales bacterium]|nr:MAG: T9SS type A sorting domain-containing protein [Sphingobacteriales bacterium]
MKRILLAATLTLSAIAAQAQLANTPFFTQMGDLCNSGCNANPQNITNCNGTLYFAANIDTLGTELCVSNGTDAGTRFVLNIAPGALGSGPKNFTVLNSKVIFMANDGVHGYEPWISDGTTTGTKMLKDIYPGTTGQVTDGFTVMNGKAYFSAGDNVNGTELWVSDGTTAGTKMLLDIDPTASSYPSNKMAVYSGKLYFSATTNSDRELWVSDGTVAGTQLLANVNPNAASGPDNFVQYNGKLYFSAFADTSGGEICVTDGTPAGTTVVTNIASAGDSLPRALTVSNNLLFFAAGTQLDSQTVWVTNGTKAGTTKLATLSTPYASRKEMMLDNDGLLYFTGAKPGLSTRDVLWQTDGTVANTKVVDNTLLSVGNMTSLKNEVYFICNNVLYHTPNTINAQAVILPANFAGIIEDKPMATMGDALYFAANYQLFYGVELWKMELIPTSVHNVGSLTNTIIYPNPASNTFSIKNNNSNNTTVRLFSLTGQLLLQTQQTENINIASLPAGNYMVQVIADGQATMQKLVKQ